MRQKLTVLVPCKDERHNIRPCIESFREFADEILIADSGSTDGTLDIVRGLGGCRLIEHEWTGYARFKNWAIAQALHPWVLIVDADERLTKELGKEIHDVLVHPRMDGYRICRQNFLFGHALRYGGVQNDKVLRLIQRDLCRYTDRVVHEDIELPHERVGYLRCKLLHYSYRTYDDVIEKLDHYTALQAQAWFEQGRRPKCWNLWLRIPGRLLHSYVLRLGFLDGAIGLQWAVQSAFYSYLKEARLWQLHHAKTIPASERVSSPLPPPKHDVYRMTTRFR